MRKLPATLTRQMPRAELALDFKRAAASGAGPRDLVRSSLTAVVEASGERSPALVVPRQILRQHIPSAEYVRPTCRDCSDTELALAALTAQAQELGMGY